MALRIKITKIRLNMHRKIFCAHIARWLITLAHKISPRFLMEYDRLTIERYFRDNEL